MRGVGSYIGVVVVVEVGLIRAWDERYKQVYLMYCYDNNMVVFEAGIDARSVRQELGCLRRRNGLV